MHQFLSSLGWPGPSVGPSVFPGSSGGREAAWNCPQCCHPKTCPWPWWRHRPVSWHRRSPSQTMFRYGNETSNAAFDYIIRVAGRPSRPPTKHNYTADRGVTPTVNSRNLKIERRNNIYCWQLRIFFLSHDWFSAAYCGQGWGFSATFHHSLEWAIIRVATQPSLTIIMDFQKLLQKAAANQKVAEKVVGRGLGSGFYPIVQRNYRNLMIQHLDIIHKLSLFIWAWVGV